MFGGPVTSGLTFTKVLGGISELKHFWNSKISQTIIKWLFLCQIFHFCI